MDGLLRHLGSEKHLKKWVEHTDSPPEMMELRHSLAEKWVAYTQDPERESYIQKRTVQKLANKDIDKAAKVAREGLVKAFTGGLFASPQARPTVTPENAAEIGARLAAD